MPKAADVTLEVFNILRQQVTILLHKPMDAGYHTIVWEGTDGGGNQVATGVCLYRLRTESFTETRTMLLLK